MSRIPRQKGFSSILVAMPLGKTRLSTTDTLAFVALILAMLGIAAVLIQPAYPEASVSLYRTILWCCVIVAALSVAFLLWHHVVQPRLKGRQLDPFLALAIGASFVAFVSLAIYAVRGSQGGGFGRSNTSTTQTSDQPELSLLPPKNRLTFKWDPTTAMYFDVQEDGVARPPGQWAFPTLILHNSSKVAAADVVVTWDAEISGIKELAKIGRLAKYDIRFPENYTMDLIASPPVPNFRYNPNSHYENSLAFVARNADLYMPPSIFAILGLFIAAKMPDELGAKTEVFPLRIEVVWNVPDGGQPKDFNVKIRGVNTKPSGVVTPEVVGYLDFEIEK